MHLKGIVDSGGGDATTKTSIPTAVLATCVLLLAVASDLLSSADALKLGMGKDWEKTMWDECKMEGRFAYQAKLGLSFLCLSCWITITSVAMLLYCHLQNERHTAGLSRSFTPFSFARFLYPWGAASFGVSFLSLMPFSWQIVHLSIDLTCCESTIYILPAKGSDNTQWGILNSRDCSPFSTNDARAGFGAAAGLIGAASVAMAGWWASKCGEVVGMTKGIKKDDRQDQESVLFQHGSVLAPPTLPQLPGYVEVEGIDGASTSRSCTSSSSRFSSRSSISNNGIIDSPKGATYISVPLHIVEEQLSEDVNTAPQSVLQDTHVNARAVLEKTSGNEPPGALNSLYASGSGGEKDDAEEGGLGGGEIVAAGELEQEQRTDSNAANKRGNLKAPRVVPRGRPAALPRIISMPDGVSSSSTESVYFSPAPAGDTLPADESGSDDTESVSEDTYEEDPRGKPLWIC